MTDKNLPTFTNMHPDFDPPGFYLDLESFREVGTRRMIMPNTKPKHAWYHELGIFISNNIGSEFESPLVEFTPHYCLHSDGRMELCGYSYTSPEVPSNEVHEFMEGNFLVEFRTEQGGESITIVPFRDGKVVLNKREWGSAYESLRKLERLREEGFFDDDI